MTAVSRFGPLLNERGVTFRLWAPAARAVKLVLDRPLAMPGKDGWFTLHVDGAGFGTRYRFEIDGEAEIPDPASHSQPDGVQGPSEVVDHGAYRWRTADWRGLPWEQTVFLEAHVGTFTRAGTFDAMHERLDHLAETGITALELMPVADFAGHWNWGYDGVLLFAPRAGYGRPHDLKMLIDAAHARGLMVFLDVVYNHFGPRGNNLPRIAPQFFSAAPTPWGAGIDYNVPEVRAFAVENALHWVRDYRFDGLRVDAVHAMTTPGHPHIVSELAAAIHQFAAQSGRHIHLVLENDDNAAHLLSPKPRLAPDSCRAQWNDDYHHAWHAFLTGERFGYYRDYPDAPAHIACALAQGFSYRGEASLHRDGRKRGEPNVALPRADFVNFVQNHDQIGNRPKAERLASLIKPAPLEAALAVLLLQPSPPLMFMGDEWGATEPFPFFCDFTGALADAVREGRRHEFADAYAGAGNDIPDPLAAATRDLAVLDWDAPRRPDHAARLLLTRRLLAVRRQWVTPLLATMVTPGVVEFTSGVLAAHWRASERSLALLANLSDSARPKPAAAWGRSIWGGPPPDRLPPWSVYAAVDDPEAAMT